MGLYTFLFALVCAEAMDTKYPDKSVVKSRPPWMNDESTLSPYEKQIFGLQDSDEYNFATMIAYTPVSSEEDLPVLDIAGMHKRNLVVRTKLGGRINTPPTTHTVQKLLADKGLLEPVVTPVKDPDYRKPILPGNWTTCDEFKGKTLFHPRDVINADWVPFYIWTPYNEIGMYSYYRFSFPSKTLIGEYKKMYGTHTKGKINWYLPKLLLQNPYDALLIAADQRGLYKVLEYLKDIPDFVKNNPEYPMPVHTFRLRFEDPYLGIMTCETGITILTAPVGQEPKTDEAREAEAAAIGFNGKGTPLERDLRQEQNAEILRKLEGKTNEVTTGNPLSSPRVEPEDM